MEQYLVQPGTIIDLGQWDPRDKSGFDGNKAAGKEVLKMLNERLEMLQELMYAEGKRKLLVVLQAMDTGGKDGVIRHVFDGVNPQGVKVASFKKPTPIELAHDYLWRVHRHTPGNGQITIFNRSHYEDVLVVRVHNLVPPEIWQERYAHINAFEHMLADEGTKIIKFFLNISKQEQKERLQARLDNPEKQWKFAVGDLKERALWDTYIGAYEAVLSKTSTTWAPWYIVPADRKWYRNLVIGTLLVQTLQGFQMQYPVPEDDIENIVIV
ncbi:MAG: polyphosphate kinase 2 family protein [Anaerolineae bacterium]|nr:polyphosphate kinase 2 family protein [Anaerolineae bacterium]